MTDKLEPMTAEKANTLAGVGHHSFRPADKPQDPSAEVLAKTLFHLFRNPHVMIDVFTKKQSVDWESVYKTILMLIQYHDAALLERAKKLLDDNGWYYQNSAGIESRASKCLDNLIEKE